MQNTGCRSKASDFRVCIHDVGKVGPPRCNHNDDDESHGDAVVVERLVVMFGAAVFDDGVAAALAKGDYLFMLMLCHIICG